MSRTVKGSKAPGYEFWSRRPGNKHGGEIGAYAKRMTHGAERRAARRQVDQEIDQFIRSESTCSFVEMYEWEKAELARLWDSIGDLDDIDFEEYGVISRPYPEYVNSLRVSR